MQAREARALEGTGGGVEWDAATSGGGGGGGGAARRVVDRVVDKPNESGDGRAAQAAGDKSPAAGRYAGRRVGPDMERLMASPLAGASRFSGFENLAALMAALQRRTEEHREEGLYFD